MRIVYIIHSLHNSGGMERVLLMKAGMLSELEGYDVWIITSHAHGRDSFFPVPEKVHQVDLGLKDPLLFQCRYRRALNKKLKELSPDITISMGGNDIYCLPRCTDGSVKIAEFHFSHDKFFGKYGLSELGKLYARYRTWKLEKAVRRLKAFVVLTKADQKHWQSIVPDVLQIYNPVPRQTLRSPLERKRFLAIGRLSPEKNFEDAILAWKMVTDVHPDWELDIYGNGTLRAELQHSIKREGLRDKVHLKGHTQDIIGELADSSGLLVTSEYEGFCMAIAEAATCGVPTVSYNCPTGPAELIENGKTGYLVPPGDPLDLANKVCHLIDGERFRMGKAALERVERLFSPETIIAQWTALLDSLKDGNVR